MRQGGNYDIERRSDVVSNEVKCLQRNRRQNVAENTVLRQGRIGVIREHMSATANDGDGDGDSDSGVVVPVVGSAGERVVLL
jgi:hypothetical protein